jgi:hypothetical protein
MNLVRYYASTTAGNGSVNDNSLPQMYRGTTALGGIQRITAVGNAVGQGGSVSFVGLDTPGSVSAQTYVIKATSSAGTGSIPAVNTDSATEILEEIMGALDEPANDNGLPEQRMVG